MYVILHVIGRFLTFPECRSIRHAIVNDDYLNPRLTKEHPPCFRTSDFNKVHSKTDV
jgi:hypothetical protein